MRTIVFAKRCTKEILRDPLNIGFGLGFPLTLLLLLNTIQANIPAKLFEALYGQPFAFKVGHKMEGNFYKCGDHTASPHWGSWVPMPRLDFHDPDSFGTFVIVE